MKKFHRRLIRWFIRWFIHWFVRDIWLTVIIFIDDRRLFADYRRRFRVSRDEFRCEAKATRRSLKLMGALLNGNFNRYWFLMDLPLD